MFCRKTNDREKTDTFYMTNKKEKKKRKLNEIKATIIKSVANIGNRKFNIKIYHISIKNQQRASARRELFHVVYLILLLKVCLYVFMC